MEDCGRLKTMGYLFRQNNVALRELTHHTPRCSHVVVAPTSMPQGLKNDRFENAGARIPEWFSSVFMLLDLGLEPPGFILERESISQGTSISATALAYGVYVSSLQGVGT